MSLSGLHGNVVLAEVLVASYPLREAETLARRTSFKHLKHTGGDSGKKTSPTLKLPGSFHGEVTLVNAVGAGNNLQTVEMQSRSQLTGKRCNVTEAGEATSVR